MDMEVEHFLSGVPPRVEDEAVSGRGEALVGRDPAGLVEDVAQEVSPLGRDVVQGGEMLLE